MLHIWCRWCWALSVRIFIILIQLYYFQCETKEEYNCAFPKVAHIVRHHTRLQGSKRSAAEPHLPQTSVQTCKLQFGLQTVSVNQESFLEGPVKKLPAFYGTSRAFITVITRILTEQCAGFDGCMPSHSVLWHHFTLFCLSDTNISAILSTGHASIVSCTLVDIRFPATLFIHCLTSWPFQIQ